MDPENPIKAVTHRDPYPYYARLVAGPPFCFHEELGMWVAARANMVAEVFASQACRVRPVVEPVPAALEGQAAGEVFAQIVRMTDGSRHAQPKLALERALAAVSTIEVKARTRQVAMRAVPSFVDLAGLNAWMLNTPTAVVANLLGFSADEQSAIADWTRQFIACLSPLSTSDQLATASFAAVQLRSRMNCLLDTMDRDPDKLIFTIQDQAASVGWVDNASLVANLIGLLSQTYEATAGLIGNAIVALARNPTLLGEVRILKDGWRQLVHESSRFDSPIQNTRRFVAERTIIGGVDLAPGAVVLLVLAAANRDAHINPDPESFRLERAERYVFSFGRGSHACPGEVLARTIAATALSTLFDAMPDDAWAMLGWAYKSSTNCRLPIFHANTVGQP